MRKSQLVVIIILFSLLSPNFLLNSQANMTNVNISSGSSQVISLGAINEGMEIHIDYSVTENIDTLLMTSSQYSAWQNGNTAHTKEAQIIMMITMITFSLQLVQIHTT